MTEFDIVAYDDARHRKGVIILWETVFGYEADHNGPETVIDKKQAHGDNLFFVGSKAGNVAGTAMAGYDGHRGWIYSIAVHPDHRHQGMGSKMLGFALDRLADLGCLKVNLQILAENEGVREFYKANGFEVEPRVSMGKTLY